MRRTGGSVSACGSPEVFPPRTMHEKEAVEASQYLQLPAQDDTDEESSGSRPDSEDMTEEHPMAHVRTSPVKCCVCGRGGAPARRREDKQGLVHRHSNKRQRRCCCCCCLQCICCRWGCLLGLMTISLCALLVVLVWGDETLRAGVLHAITLSEGSQRDTVWRAAEFDVYYTVRVFNLTNPRGFMAGNRPRVREMGPYVYLLKETKEQVQYNEDGTTVQYRGRPNYYFQPQLSEGTEEDLVTTVNIPFVNAADLVKGTAPVKTVLQMAKKVHGFDTVVRLSVGELLWGHQSRVLNWARGVQDVPYPHQQFGLLMGLNNTLTPPYVMHTGKSDPSQLNQILSYDGHEVLNKWHGDLCDIIRGTDGNGFHPGVLPDETLYFFNGQLCRSLPLVYNSTVDHRGLQAYRFTYPRDVFTYGEAQPDNQCFCDPADGCPPRGTIDMGPCFFDAAVYFSFPHFYLADPKLRHLVLGLRPDPKKHRTEFDIYPDLGIPLRVKLRMQMNVMLDRHQALERDRHFDVVLPVFWFEVGIDSLPGEMVGLLKLAQNLPPVVKTTSVTLCTALTLIFLLLLLAQTVATWCGWGSRRLKRPLTPEDLPHHTHYRPAPPTTWQYDELQKPPKRGDSYSSSSLGADVPVIDDHTLLPPYRRTNDKDTPDASPHYEDDYTMEPDQVPPPYSPGPTQRTPSTVSVEIHTTASDEEVAELPVDAPPATVASLGRPPPAYTTATQPSAPLLSQGVAAPLAQIEDDCSDPEPSYGSCDLPPTPEDSTVSPAPPDVADITEPVATTEPLATSSPHSSVDTNTSSPGNRPPPLESAL